MSKRDLLIQKLPVLEEAFVSIYGENYREIIHDTLFKQIFFIICEGDHVIDSDVVLKHLKENNWIEYPCYEEILDDGIEDGNGVTISEFYYDKDDNLCLESGIIFSLSKDLNDDFTLIHEINHAIETKLHEDYYNFSWSKKYDYELDDLYEFTCTDNKYFTSLLMFEVFNDLIVEDVYNYLNSLDIHIFDEGKKISDDDVGGYDFPKFMVKDLFNKYRDDFIECRTSGDIEGLINKFGIDNVVELNDMFLDFERDFYVKDDDMIFLDEEKFDKNYDLIKKYKDRSIKLKENIDSKKIYTM